MANPSKISGVARDNIESVTQISRDFAKGRTKLDRLGDAVTRIAASPGFLAAHFVGVVAWISINLRAIPGCSPFDPYPFSLLGVLVSLEAVLLAIFVLMAQKRQTQQADHWAHLNLQVGLLSEQEATKMLQMLTAISDRLGVRTSHDTELKEMAQKTVVDHLHQELAENLARTDEEDHQRAGAPC